MFLGGCASVHLPITSRYTQCVNPEINEIKNSMENMNSDSLFIHSFTKPNRITTHLKIKNE